MRRPWMIVRQAWRETLGMDNDRDRMRVWVEAVRTAREEAVLFGIVTSLESVRDAMHEVNETR